MAVENKGDTNQYIWWATTHLEEKKAFFRNVYNSSEFTKLLDGKDQKAVNLDSGKTWPTRSSSIVGKQRNDRGVISMAVNLPIKLKSPFSLHSVTVHCFCRVSLREPTISCGWPNRKEETNHWSEIPSFSLEISFERQGGW